MSKEIIIFLLIWILARYLTDLLDNIFAYINNKITLKMNKDTSEHNIKIQEIQNKIDELGQVQSNVMGFQIPNEETEYIEEEQ